MRGLHTGQRAKPRFRAGLKHTGSLTSMKKILFATAHPMHHKQREIYREEE